MRGAELYRGFVPQRKMLAFQVSAHIKLLKGVDRIKC